MIVLRPAVLFTFLVLLVLPTDFHEDPPAYTYGPDPEDETERPAVLTRDDQPRRVGVGRPGIGSDYRPKPARDRDYYEDYDRREVPRRRTQLPRPTNDRYDRRPVRGGYAPKPGDGNYRRGSQDPPPRNGGGYRRGYDDRDDAVRNDKDEYLPRPVRGGNNDKDEYVPRPIRGGNTDKDEYLPRPVRGGNNDKDEYVPKPVGGGDDKKDNKKCICVPYYQCTDGHIVTDGAGIIDSRKKKPEVDEEEELPPYMDPKFHSPSCGPFHVCCSAPETPNHHPPEHRCGRKNPTGINSRILSPSNKGEADFGEWPWQAAVLKAEGKINIFMCGAVLIDKLHVLTVAHCVFHLHQNNEYPLKVRLGEWDTQTNTEFLAHQDYDVSKIIVHPEFRNTSLWNDIAILRLEEPVLFAPHIDTVCLPKHDENFVDYNCIVTGWGKDAYRGGPYSNVMKEVAIQVIDSEKCEGMLRKTRLGRFFQLHEGFLCAGGESGLDSCKGDGGGPLVCNMKEKSFVLAGIVSWGLDCGQVEVPGVYTKIQAYNDWISKNTGVQLKDYWPKKHH